ncbi:MAG: hypothetical protein V3U32_06085 [Anaerolineales bacterium]
MPTKQPHHTEAADRGGDRLIDALVGAARRWGVLIGGPATAAVAAALGTLLATVILLRLLPGAEAGHFVLILAVLQTLGMVANLGQNNVLTRRYSVQPLGAHDWPRDLGASLIIAAPVILAGTLVAARLYDLPTAYWVFLLVALILRVPLHAMAYMLTAKRHYTWGNLLLRLPNSLLILPALVLLFIPELATLNPVLLWLLVSLVLVNLLGLALLVHHFPRGTLTITLRQRADGLILLASTGTQNLPNNGLVALAGAILLPAQLATFAAMAVLMRPFRLLSNILVMILTPELIRQYRPSYTRMLIGILGLAALAGVFTAIVGPPLASWVYAGRYDDGITLIPILVLAGSLRLAGSLPRSYLLGRARTSTLNRYVVVMAIAVLVALLLGILLTDRLGIVGLAVGITLIELANASLNYLFLRVAHRQEPLQQSAS